MLCFGLIEQCILFFVVFLMSRVFIILVDTRRRRTSMPENLLTTKRGCVRTLIVLGSGTDDIDNELAMEQQDSFAILRRRNRQNSPT